MKQIYLDYGATSAIKPPHVKEAIDEYFASIMANPGRGGYGPSLQMGRLVFDTRMKLMTLFSAKEPENVIFTSNITHSMNMVLRGLLRRGDHVITTSMEHNSVISPLKAMEEEGLITLTIIKANEEGFVIGPIAPYIKENTALIIMTHGSNVTGAVMPIRQLFKEAKEKGIITVLDSAQTAGILPIHMEEDSIDVLCFTGHKGLLGPTGIGGIIIQDEVAKKMKPLTVGGTGSNSHLLMQPSFLPDKLEAGTLNTLSIAGLHGSLTYLEEVGIDTLYQHEKKLLTRLREGLAAIPGITCHGPLDKDQQVAVLSITADGMDCGELSAILATDYGIMTRPGLHCAPLAHDTIGTMPYGTLRFSIGPFNTMEEIEYTITSMIKIMGEQ